MNLNGEYWGVWPEGIPCHTNKMDHFDTADFGPGSVEFNGRINGEFTHSEVAMLGDCFEVRKLLQSKDFNECLPVSTVIPNIRRQHYVGGRGHLGTSGFCRDLH